MVNGQKIIQFLSLFSGIAAVILGITPPKAMEMSWICDDDHYFRHCDLCRSGWMQDTDIKFDILSKNDRPGDDGTLRSV